MTVGLLVVRLLVRESRSLKDKRRVVQSVKGQVSAKFNVSIAEVDMQDDRKLAELAIAIVGTDDTFVRKQLTAVRRHFELMGGAEFVSGDVELVY